MTDKQMNERKKESRNKPINIQTLDLQQSSITGYEGGVMGRWGSI